MIERVIFTSDADDDVAASYDWYESREPGLGEEFQRSIEACVRGIQLKRKAANRRTPKLIDGDSAPCFRAVSSRA